MRRNLIALLAPFLLAGAAYGQEARLLRFPATNGVDLAFTYAGDLYRAPLEGGRAARLTADLGEETFPHYSPDGKTLAFSAQYDGNTEVYIMPASGGTPKRITFTATNARDDLGDRMGPNNIVMGWTPDGKHVIYRNRIGHGFTGKLWLADTAVSLPTELPLPEGGFCSYSPDGRMLAYNRVFREFRTWKYYTGGMADDIWIYDFSTRTTRNITSTKAQDVFPMWIGEDIYYLSDRDRTMNLFVYSTKTQQTQKVTHYDDYDVKFPTAHGQHIVYEKGGYIFRYNTATGQREQVHIRLAPEGADARPKYKDGKNYIRAISLPNRAENLAITARGECFIVPVNTGVTKNFTRTPGAHERQAEYAPDGKTIAYLSDRTGEYEVWLYTPSTDAHRQLTHGTTSYILRFVWSPDSKTIAYTTRANELHAINVESGINKCLMKSDVAVPRGVVFAPDSDWIAYTMPAANNYSVVYARNLTRNEEYALTSPWYNALGPRFSDDGKHLYFNSARNFTPTYGSLEWNHVYSNMYGLYMVPLSRATGSPFLVRAQSESSSVEPQGKRQKNSPKAHEGARLRIDLEGIADRVINVPTGRGYHHLLFADGNRVVYSRGGGTYSFDLMKKQETELLKGGQLGVTPDRKHAYVDRQGLYVIPMPSSKASPSNPVNLNDMRILVDYQKEWRQIYNEAWRIYRDWFYVSNMHGVDWQAIHDKYAALLPYVKTRLDLNYLIGEMIGELNVGHAYVNPGERTKAPRIPMGMLGADLVKDAQGYRIARIFPGASWNPSLNSPLNVPGLDVLEGDYITAIDGIPTDSTANPYALLIGKAGRLTELTIRRPNGRPESHRIVVKPIADEYPIRHYEWVQRNIRAVDSLSEGKIGYIYLPNMVSEGLNEFARLYYPQLDKQALILDDRGNGGGNVSPQILERLLREPYRLTMSRFNHRLNCVPEGTFSGPKVCLINKYSASDGDLFPWGFKALKLGRIIGVRSWGGIVGISGSAPYMDGTDIRVPFFTSLDPQGHWIVENHGVDPDIVVDNDPAEEYAGHDEQLRRAVQLLMDQLKSRPPLPPIPPARVWNP